MKCLLIYTPFSKKGNFKPYIQKAKMILGEKYEVIDFIKTKKEGHATEIAKSSCGVYDLLLVAGGDGLFNEVISGIAEQDNKPRIAFLPSGTVNDSARSLKVPFNFEKALKVAINGVPFKTDIMKYENKFAFYVIVLGYCAKSIYTTSSLAKRLFGWLAYFFKGIKSFFVHQRMHLKIKTDIGEEIDDIFTFVLLYNSRSVAGFGINKDALLDDGFVDVVLIKDHGKGLINFFKNLFKVVKIFALGAKRLKNNKNTIIRKVKSIKIENFDNNVFNVDGSYGGNEDIDLIVLKQSVDIMVPLKSIKTNQKSKK